MHEYLRQQGIDIWEIRSIEEAVKRFRPNLHERFVDLMKDLMDKDNGAAATRGDLSAMYNFLGVHDVLDIQHAQRIEDITIKNSAIVLEHVLDDNVRTVWDVACCGGLKTVFYGLNRPNTQITGTDNVSICVRAAEQRARRFGCENVSFVEGDYLEEVPGTDYDVVLANYVFEEGFELSGKYGRGGESEVDFDFPRKLRSLKAGAKKGGTIMVSFKTQLPDKIGPLLSAAATMNGLRLTSDDYSFDGKSNTGEWQRHLVHLYQKL
jgi:hypothetical protein